MLYVASMDAQTANNRSLLLSVLAFGVGYHAGRRRGRLDEALAQDTAQMRRLMNTRGFRAPTMRRERDGS